MTTYDEYLKNVFQQILDSYTILENLKDKSGDLDVITREIAKITGLFTAISNKLDASRQEFSEYLHLLPYIKFYLENNDFYREIKILGLLYSDDSMRLKNLRLTIIHALSEKNLIEHIKTILRS